MNGKRGGWLALGGLTLLSFLFSPMGPPPLAHPARLFCASALSFPFLLWIFGRWGPLPGLGSAVWLGAWMGIMGLAAREPAMGWLWAAFLLFGILAHRVTAVGREALRRTALEEERAREESRALEGEMKRLDSLRTAAQERLKRYQMLRQIANTFTVRLFPDDLVQAILQSAAGLVAGADRAILYLVNPDTLELELQQVRRRSGAEAIRAKRGDAFDHWVMRQGQPLLVEEVSRDFRFPEESARMLGRPLGAVLVVPLVTHSRALGLLRLESVAPRGLDGDDLRLAGILGDLASLGLENSRLYHRMVQLAMTDDLTGLAVRGVFERRLSEEMARAAAGGRPLSVLVIDIDHFKGYNDTFGHSFGDKLLKHIGQILLEMRGPSDLAARFGGEEFVCLFPGAELPAAQDRAERIRARVASAPVELRRTLTQATVSIGVAAQPLDGATPEALMAAADRGLYRAKGLGRNRVCGEG